MQLVAHPGWEEKTGRLHQTYILLGIILITYLVHGLSPVTTSTDSAWTLHLSASILREGNINLDEYRSLINLPLDYRLRVVDGHILFLLPIGDPTPRRADRMVYEQNLPFVYPTDFYTYLARHAPDSRTAKIEKNYRVWSRSPFCGSDVFNCATLPERCKVLGLDVHIFLRNLYLVDRQPGFVAAWTVCIVSNFSSLSGHSGKGT